MSEKKSDKPARKPADVDALLTEVASAAKIKAPAAKPAARPAAAPAPPAPAKAAEPPAPPKTVRVRQVKSGICTPVDQKAALKGLGLRGIRTVSTLPDTPSVRGQIRKVRHLVAVED